MNYFFLLIFLLTFTFGNTQTRSFDSLSILVSKEITFCGQVTGSYYSKSDTAITLLNFGGTYPNNKLSAAIFKKDLSKFITDPQRYYMNRNVCIKGIVKIYKEKLEIVLERSDQIWVE